MNYEIAGSSTLFGDKVKRMRRMREALIDEAEQLGYEEIMIPNFEDYDLYKSHRGIDRLGMVKTIDNDGRVLVLRPDATVGIARFVSSNFPNPYKPVKLFYCSTVFREFKGVKKTGRDFIQGGVEYFGVSSVDCEAEVIALAIKIIRKLTINHLQLGLGSTAYLGAFLSTLGLSPEDELTILDYLESRDLSHLIPFLHKRRVKPHDIEALTELTSLVGPLDTVLPKAKELIRNSEMDAALSRLDKIGRLVRQADQKIEIKLDFTLTKRFNYYTDTIFELYAGGMHVPVVSGGRYDSLAEEFGSSRPAVGFGMNFNLLLDYNEDTIREDVTIAIAKSRFTDEVMDKLAANGLTFPDYEKGTRRLLFEDGSGKYRVILVKSPDVLTYVESGAADIGIVGSDILDEGAFDGYVLKTTDMGKCHMSFARLKTADVTPSNGMTVASTYPKITAEYLAKRGVSANLIKLHGSVELGPIVGLSDIIVDIVESGSTLRENGLEELESFLDIATTVICNKISFKTKQDEIESLLKTFD